MEYKLNHQRMTEGEPLIMALRSPNGIYRGRPEELKRGNGKSASISRRDLMRSLAIAFWMANWLAFKYLTVVSSP